ARPSSPASAGVPANSEQAVCVSRRNATDRTHACDRADAWIAFVEGMAVIHKLKKIRGHPEIVLQHDDAPVGLQNMSYPTDYGSRQSNIHLGSMNVERGESAGTRLPRQHALHVSDRFDRCRRARTIGEHMHLGALRQTAFCQSIQSTLQVQRPV